MFLAEKKLLSEGLSFAHNDPSLSGECSRGDDKVQFHNLNIHFNFIISSADLYSHTWIDFMKGGRNANIKFICNH